MRAAPATLAAVPTKAVLPTCKRCILRRFRKLVVWLYIVSGRSKVKRRCDMLNVIHSHVFVSQKCEETLIF